MSLLPNVSDPPSAYPVTFGVIIVGMIRFAPFLVVLALLAGCAHRESTSGIRHLVFFELADPADAAALLHDADTRVPTIPGVEDYWSGTPHDTKREAVVIDYHVALGMSFADDATYAAYLVHPDHEELVAAWGPKLANVQVRDVRP